MGSLGAEGVALEYIQSNDLPTASAPYIFIKQTRETAKVREDQFFPCLTTFTQLIFGV